MVLRVFGSWCPVKPGATAVFVESLMEPLWLIVRIYQSWQEAVIVLLRDESFCGEQQMIAVFSSDN